MICNMCKNTKNKFLFENKSNYREIAEDLLEEYELRTYTQRFYIDGEDEKSLMEDYPYYNITKTIKGYVCPICDTVNIIQNEKCYDESCEPVGSREKVLYPSKKQIELYEKKISLIDNEVHKNYTDTKKILIESEVTALAKLRTTLDVLIEDISNKKSHINNLCEGINQMNFEKIISDLHKIRIDANKAVHDGKTDCTSDDINNMIYYVENLINVFYFYR